MDVSKLFRPSKIRRLSKDETIALYKRHMMAQYERAETAERELARLEEGLRHTADELASRRGMIDRLVAADRFRALLAEGETV